MASAFGRVDSSFSPLLLAPPSSRVTALSNPPLFGEVGTSNYHAEIGASNHKGKRRIDKHGGWERGK